VTGNWMFHPLKYSTHMDNKHHMEE